MSDMKSEDVEPEVLTDAGGQSAKPKKRRWLAFGIVSVLVVGLIAVLGAIAWYGRSVTETINSIERSEELMPDDDFVPTGEDPELFDEDAEGPEPVPSAKPDAEDNGEGEEQADGEPSKDEQGEADGGPGKAEQEQAGKGEGGEAAGHGAGPGPGDSLNILILGSDTRGGERGRADVFMIAHVAGDRKSIDLVSIPRDYWVPIPGRRTAKINASYAWGGAPLAVSTVQRMLNVKIDHVAVTDFQGYENAIDVLGGVTVHNQQASSAAGYSWPAGAVTLSSGKEAKAFVRQRYGLKGGDFGRGERQRAVMKGVYSKMASQGVLADPGKFNAVLKAIGPSFTVDSGLTNDKIRELAMGLGVDGARNVRSHMAPTSGFGTSSDRQSYVRADQGRLAQLSRALYNDQMDSYR